MAWPPTDTTPTDSAQIALHSNVISDASGSQSFPGDRPMVFNSPGRRLVRRRLGWGGGLVHSDGSTRLTQPNTIALQGLVPLYLVSENRNFARYLGSQMQLLLV